MHKEEEKKHEEEKLRKKQEEERKQAPAKVTMFASQESSVTKAGNVAGQFGRRLARAEP